MEDFCASACLAQVIPLVLIVSVFGIRAMMKSQNAEQKKLEEARMLKEHPDAWLKLKDMEHERLRVEALRLEKAKADRPAGGGLTSGLFGLIFKILFGLLLKR